MNPPLAAQKRLKENTGSNRNRLYSPTVIADLIKSINLEKKVASYWSGDVDGCNLPVFF